MARTLILGQRRIEIGRALQTCMIQKGSYESTSVKDIARQAGLTTSLVHYYFNSKDKILFFISDIALHEVSNQLDELLHLKNNEDRIVLLRETLFDQEQNKFIISSGDVCGSVMFLQNKESDRPGDAEQKLIQAAASYLGKQMEL